MTIGKQDLPRIAVFLVALLMVGAGLTLLGRSVLLPYKSLVVAPPNRRSAPSKSRRSKVDSSTPRLLDLPAKDAALAISQQPPKQPTASEPARRAAEDPPLLMPRTAPAPRPASPAGLPPLRPLLSGPAAAEEVSGPPPTVLWLSGLIQGDPRLAVIRRGDNRYLVREGDTVEGSYRVVRIAADRVTLQRGGRKQSLRLGQY